MDTNEDEQMFFSRLSTHVSRRNISFESFWTSARLCVHFEELLKMCDQAGFEVYFQEIQGLKSAYPDELISIKELISQVEYWRNRNINLTDFVSSRNPTRSIFNNNNNNNETRSRYTHNSQRKLPSNNKSIFHQARLADTINNNLDVTYKTQTESGNRKRLLEHRQKERRLDLQLHRKIIYNQNEEEFELMMKVAEANELATKLKKNVSYLLNKNDKTGVLSIWESRAGGEATTINHKNFMKQYMLLKEESMSTVTYDKEISEEDLKKCLIETMFISQQLEEQIRLLKAKNITSNVCKI